MIYFKNNIWMLIEKGKLLQWDVQMCLSCHAETNLFLKRIFGLRERQTLLDLLGLITCLYLIFSENYTYFQNNKFILVLTLKNLQLWPWILRLNISIHSGWNITIYFLVVYFFLGLSFHSYIDTYSLIWLMLILLNIL